MPRKTGDKFVFRIISPNQSQNAREIGVNTEEEMQSWMKEIRECSGNAEKQVRGVTGVSVSKPVGVVVLSLVMVLLSSSLKLVIVLMLNGYQIALVYQ